LGKSDAAWWSHNRVLIIHAGGESRRLPEYSLTGKLFGILPERTPWGENSTVFDETLALSTLWLERFSSGLAVSSGDVVLTFDAVDLDWGRPGVVGAAIRQPLEVGTHHGVYVLDECGRVYSFLQKPTPAEVRAAGVHVTRLGGHEWAHWLSLPLTVAWLLICTNAVNLIDGIDGLATGIGLFATTTMVLAALMLDR
jgi:hypothetical protein